MDFPKNEFVERKGTKAVIRLQATRVAGLVPKIEEAKDALDSYLAGVLTQYLATFGQHFAVWSAAVTCVAELDCLLSLAKTSAFGGGTLHVPPAPVIPSPPPTNRCSAHNTVDRTGTDRPHVPADVRGRRARGDHACARSRRAATPLHHPARGGHLHPQRHQVRHFVLT